jgi:hypothetical protein
MIDDQTLLGLFDSLTREIGDLKLEVHQGIQRIEARLARQGGIIEGGTRQVSRLITWSEEIDAMIAERDGQIQELRQRVEALEKK